jgi:hypothetical protein
VLDRKAERRVGLLDELVREGSSINDVTRDDLLVAVPGKGLQWSPGEPGRPGLDAWVADPHKRWKDGVSAPGLVLSEVNRDAWASRKAT